MKSMLTRYSLALGLLVSASSINAAPTEADLNKFVEETSKEKQIPAAYIREQLAIAEKNPTVISRIQTPWEAKPWHQYYPIFLKEERISAGVNFWKAHEETLKRAEKTYGVAPEMIVAILGVETLFGKHKGKYSVLDSLYSLGFHYPVRKGYRDRGPFFKSELAHFMKLAYQEEFDSKATKGSYAGAMGWGQFIPSSYLHYAVDFDADGKRDLFNNPVDAIGSVANYFAEHKWKSGEPVAYQVKLAKDDATKFVSRNPKPKHQIHKLVASGVSITEDLNFEQKAALLAMEQPDHKDYWLGLHNFYVITRYNHSPLYGLAAFLLSQEIKTRYDQS